MTRRIIVRDYVKWDDQANNLQDFAEGLVRAYDLATTAPMGPVMVVIDADQQEEELEPGRKLFIPKLRARARSRSAIRTRSPKRQNCSSPPKIPSSLPAATRAPKPARSAWSNWPSCCRPPVVDERNRMNMPSRHPLNHSAARRGA